MEMFLSQIDWTPVLVSFVISFAVGWLWYSPKLFLKGWLKGIGEPVWQAPMWMSMFAQAGSTLFLAILINVSVAQGHLIQATLIVFTIAGFIKANGLYCGKTKFAISVEVLYIIVMAAIMVAVNLCL